MTSAEDFDKKYAIIDVKPPRHKSICAIYKQSFAYYTVRHRLPITITTIIDTLTKSKDELVVRFGEDSREEIKTVVGLLSKLKYELQTDKPMALLTDNEVDQESWNLFLQKLPAEKNSYFKACWLYSECYMYRRVFSFFALTRTLRDYDYFESQKKHSLEVSVPAMLSIITATRRVEKSEATLSNLLMINLWGNRADLSFRKELTGIELNMPSKLSSNILINNTTHVWNCLMNPDVEKDLIIDIVTDNTGFEIFTDLLLAEYLIEKQFARKVRFHLKAIPWYISDATAIDLRETLKFWQEHSSSVLRDVGKKWTQYFGESIFELMAVNHFWTGPHEFYCMRDVDPELYKTLSQAHLVFFKGDLSYRKLIGDFNWDSTEDFITCLRGFLPTNLCTLRTIKSELICGLRYGLANELYIENPDWMVTGEYGVIQFAEKTNCGCLAEA